MYVDVVNLFKDVCESVNPVGTFYHGRASDAKIFLDTYPHPQIHLYSFTIQKQPNNSLDIVNGLQLAVILEDSPHSDNEEMLTIIDEADKIQRKIRAALDTRDIQYSNWQARPFFKDFLGVKTGMIITLNLTLNSREC